MNKQTYELSEIELRYNPVVPAIKKPRIKCSQDAHKQFLELMDRTQFNIKEEAAVLFVNRSKRVIGGYKVSSGGIAGTVVDIRIILGMALKCLASGFILAHSHPSGDLSPSKQDLDLTIRLMEAGKLMEIQLLDHLIITENSYLSMAEDDLI
jgi:DNA repair protein RadC